MAEDHTLQLMITPALTQLPRDRLVLTMVTGPHPGAVQEVDVEVVLGRGEDLPHRLFDIDHFKKVNDTHGHLAGDSVLRQLGALIRGRVRRDDTPARTGGEEFAIVARGVERVGGLQLGERVRTAVERMAVPWQDQTIRITVSVGVACHGQRARYASAEELLLAADQAVYRAKSDGRNRVVGA
jgi:diguanylate cyclase (GGDEF)-like protein